MEDRCQVIALASVDGEDLFLLRYPCKQQIEVYCAKTFKWKRNLPIAGLSDHHFNAMTACVKNNCLYISDYEESNVFRVYLSSQNESLRWTVHDIPIGLSVNHSNNLLVTCYGAPKILEITPHGSLVNEIDIELSDKSLHIWHAIQLTLDRYLVCISSGPFSIFGDVVEVDSRGRIVFSYKNQLHSATGHRLKWPCHLAVYGDDGCIFVVDRDSERLVMLKRSMKRPIELNESVDGKRLSRPWCIYLHRPKSSQDTTRLFVGNDNGPTLVFDIGRHRRRILRL